MPSSGLRVLIGADTFPPDINGASFFAGRLARGLARRGHDVHVVCPSSDGPAGTEQHDGYTIHRIRSRAIPFHGDYQFCTLGGARQAIEPLLDRGFEAQYQVLLGRPIAVALATVTEEVVTTA